MNIALAEDLDFVPSTHAKQDSSQLPVIPAPGTLMPQQARAHTDTQLKIINLKHNTHTQNRHSRISARENLYIRSSRVSNTVSMAIFIYIFSILTL